MHLPSTLESYVIVYSKVKDKIKHCGIFYDVFSQQLRGFKVNLKIKQ